LKALPCDRNQDLEDEEVDPDLVDTIHYALRWKEMRLNTHASPCKNIGFTSQSTYAEEANLG
jgi:hypothetical protein